MSDTIIEVPGQACDICGATGIKSTQDMKMKRLMMARNPGSIEDELVECILCGNDLCHLHAAYISYPDPDEERLFHYRPVCVKHIDDIQPGMLDTMKVWNNGK